jgi:hypothetical protein
MRKLLPALVVCTMASLSPCRAEPVMDRDTDSGNFMLQSCQHVLSQKPPFDLLDGKCMGVIKTLVFLGIALPDEWKFCAPNKSTPEQALRVVVKYMEAHPGKLHLNFTELSMSALAEAWPCR